MKKLLLILIPFLPIAVLNIWAEINRERFPNPMAIHWGITGEPDGFASLETHLFWVNLVLGMLATIWLLITFSNTPRALKRMFQLIFGLVYVLLSLMLWQTLVGQLDLPNAQDARFGFELLIWLVPIFGIAPLLLSKPQVQVSDRLSISLRGIPFLKLQYSEIESAKPSKVAARDFGGWGIRYAKKTTAFVPSSGPALELVLAGGARVLVRTDDATELAAQIESRRSGK